MYDCSASSQNEATVEVAEAWQLVEQERLTAWHDHKKRCIAVRCSCDVKCTTAWWYMLTH